jgi:putative transposase
LQKDYWINLFHYLPQLHYHPKPHSLPKFHNQHRPQLHNLSKLNHPPIHIPQFKNYPFQHFGLTGENLSSHFLAVFTLKDFSSHHPTQFLPIKVHFPLYIFALLNFEDTKWHHKEEKLEHTKKSVHDIARYGLISELLHGVSSGITLLQRLEEAASRSWNHPQHGAIQIKADTLRHWIYRYRKGGIVGLEDNERKDKGTTQISKKIIERFTVLRGEYPFLTTERILNKLLLEGLWNGCSPSRSAFYRMVVAHKLNRKKHGEGQVKDCHAFAYDKFGQMWVSDFLHGPQVRMGRHLKKTYLLAIMDDATRYIVYADFCFAEDTAALIDGLSMAIRRFGIPERFYTDNGSAFKSRHLQYVAARLTMSLPHTPAYRPQGRGKIERFFRTVREQALTEVKGEAMDTLKTTFTNWLQEYHHRIHDSLGCSPLSKRLHVTSVARMLPETASLEVLFSMQETRKIQRDGTIHLLGKVFDIKNALPGEVVTLHYLPWDLSILYVGNDKIPAYPVDLLKNAKRYENNPLRRKEIKQ